VVVKPAAKSLILDLLSTLRHGSMPVRALVEAGELFGLAGNNVRVALARLVAAGLVERDERGRYCLGRSARAVQARVSAWRRHHERLGVWSGTWVAVRRARPPRRGAAAARRSSRALRLLGFRELEPGLTLRPDNLVGGVAAVRDQLRALGLEPGALVAGLSDLDAVSDRRARGLWDPQDLCAAYATSRHQLAESAARLPSLSQSAAMVETFLLGGRVLRQLIFDPLLPEPIVPAAPRRELVDEMRTYDRLGRSCWAGFLSGFDVPHFRNPVDLRVADDAGLGQSLPALTAVES